jgi:lauroyl/myristoyl acyltransferase
MGATVQVIDEARGPVPQDDRIRDANPVVRLYASRYTHRLVPARAALAMVSLIGPVVRERRTPGERRAAESFMHELLLHTPRRAEASELAGRWLVEKSRLRELFWRPWLLKQSQVQGREHWDEARRGGEGCVIVFGHLVATWAVPAILGVRGFDHYIVVGPHYWQPMPPGYEGLALLHRRKEYGEKVLGNPRLISTEGRPSRLPELVSAGESVAIAFDAPGRAATPFLGRVVGLGGGAASLAFATRSKVLPVVPERHGTRLDLRFHAPLDANEYDDARSLRAAIARTFEPIVLARPESVELAWFPSPLVTEVEPQVARDPADKAANPAH